jgi:hypothetical protein
LTRLQGYEKPLLVDLAYDLLQSSMYRLVDPFFAQSQ